MKKLLLSVLCMSLVSMGLRAPGYENRISEVVDFQGQTHKKNIRSFGALTDYALELKNEQLGKKNMPYFIYGSDGERGENMTLVQDENDFLRALWCGGRFMLTREQLRDAAPREKNRIERAQSAGSQPSNRVPRRLFPVTEGAVSDDNDDDMPRLEHVPGLD